MVPNRLRCLLLGVWLDSLFSSKENRGHYIWVQVFCNTPEPFTLMRSILTRHVTSREKFRNRFHEKISPSSIFSFPKKNQNSTCTKNWKMHSLKKCDHIHSLFTLFSGAMGKRPWSAVASSTAGLGRYIKGCSATCWLHHVHERVVVAVNGTTEISSASDLLQCIWLDVSRILHCRVWSTVSKGG